ncbi:MAG: 23S rRNA (guanosine(2251)-2'-O)-methyltransferase RlmB [Nocardioidaceae bacterium]|jgi:23S rRNA (guanosine2251-2'-O)-methyltransferase|nr:23S rRNA (guanosine(2251)-2'-O)-methyltransferase RlmB [Nocardioidaceae bacterium]
MAGNSKRTGAIRKRQGGNPTAGSGGRRRRALEGRGPTPKASERQGHKVHRTPTSDDSRAQPSRRPTRSSRGAPTSEWVAGRNAVVEALQAGVPVTALYVAARAERDDRLREAFRIAADRHISMLEVTRSELDKMTDRAVHQGLAMKVPPYDYADPNDLPDRARDAAEIPLIVALDSVTDPRNLGAVVRSAAAFGAHGVVLPERRAAGMTASAWKTSAGAAARVPVARATNLTRQLKAYKDDGLIVAGLDADGEVSIGDMELAAEPLVLVVGSEGKGLSRLVRETCDVLVRIPMATTTESLNAGVAAGIALYQIDRRRTA